MKLFSYFYAIYIFELKGSTNIFNYLASPNSYGQLGMHDFW